MKCKRLFSLSFIKNVPPNIAAHWLATGVASKHLEFDSRQWPCQRQRQLLSLALPAAPLMWMAFKCLKIVCIQKTLPCNLSHLPNTRQSKMLLQFGHERETLDVSQNSWRECANINHPMLLFFNVEPSALQILIEDICAFLQMFYSQVLSSRMHLRSGVQGIIL